MRYSMAVLGNASKSQALLIAEDGSFLRHERDQGMEWRDSSYGLPAITTRQLVERLARSQNLKFHHLVGKCEVVMIAMAGLDERHSGERFRNQLADCQVRPESVVFRSLAEANHAGAFHCGPGVLLRCGHGSSAFIKDYVGRTTLIGGGGRLVGDHGSGFWLGKKSLQTVARVRDGRATSEERAFSLKLLEKVFNSLDFSRPFDLIEETVHILAELGVRRFLTEFGKSAVSLAEAGDDFARSLVDVAFAHLLDLIDRPLRTLDCNESLALCLRGSMIEEGTYFRNGLLQHIYSRVPNLKSPSDGRNGAHSDVVGAGLLALNPARSAATTLNEKQSVFVSSVTGYGWSESRPPFIGPLLSLTAVTHR
jgi:N-acetylglucosamine kinase-like BadF-type ATPase